MSVKRDEILDAAEARIRQAGYNGFSFRDIAADVGVKSASVHHHFPTKGALAAAVARRYTDRFVGLLESGTGDDIVALSLRAFRYSLEHDKRMCLCGILAAEINDIPPEVAAEARRFFERTMSVLANGLPKQKADGTCNAVYAAGIIATLEGAMLLAQAFQDITLFDRATSDLARP